MLYSSGNWQGIDREFSETISLFGLTKILKFQKKDKYEGSGILVGTLDNMHISDMTMKYGALKQMTIRKK